MIVIKTWFWNKYILIKFVITYIRKETFVTSKCLPLMTVDTCCYFMTREGKIFTGIQSRHSSYEDINNMSRSRSRKESNAGESRTDHGFPKFRDWSQERPKGQNNRSRSLTRQTSRNSTLSRQNSVVSNTRTRPSPRNVQILKFHGKTKTIFDIQSHNILLSILHLQRGFSSTLVWRTSSQAQLHQEQSCAVPRMSTHIRRNLC